MKIVEAWWEIPSLGLRTIEITLAKGDPPPPASSTAGFQHLIVKVPTTELATIHALEAEGFRLVECQFTVSRSTKGRLCDDVTERFAKQIAPSSSDTQEAEKVIFPAIRAGLFDSDRIYLDPNWGPRFSSKRYENWVTQMLAEPDRARIHLLRLARSGTPVGFTSIRIESEHEAQFVLAGIFGEYQNRGFGAAMVYWSLELAKGYGKSIARTSISASNLRIFGLYSHFDFNFDECHAVFRRIVP